MGMYTEFHFNSELPKETPVEVILVLEYLCTGKGIEPEILPKHPFFKCTRWRMICSCDSYYFDADTHSTIRFDSIGDSYYLCIRSNIKNYDDEIDLFVEWITPYLDKWDGEFLGFKRYEENEWPTLLHHPKRWTSTQSLKKIGEY